MSFGPPTFERTTHMKRSDIGFLFKPEAVDIAIMDNRGHVIWQKKKAGELDSLCWEGIDLEGQSVLAGSYLCKIVYEDQKVVYVPFVFMR